MTYIKVSLKESSHHPLLPNRNCSFTQKSFLTQNSAPVPSGYQAPSSGSTAEEVVLGNTTWMSSGNTKSAQQIYSPSTSKRIWSVWELGENKKKKKEKTKIKEPATQIKHLEDKSLIYAFLHQILYSCASEITALSLPWAFFSFSFIWCGEGSDRWCLSVSVCVCLSPLWPVSFALSGSLCHTTLTCNSF